MTCGRTARSTCVTTRSGLAAAVLRDRALRAVATDTRDTQGLTLALAQLASDAVAALAQLAHDAVASDGATPLEATYVAPHAAELALGAGAPGPGLDRAHDAVAHLEGGADRHEQGRLGDARDLGHDALGLLGLGAHALRGSGAGGAGGCGGATTGGLPAARGRAALAGCATRSPCRAVVPFGFELERVVVAARGVVRLRVAWPRLAAALRCVREVVVGAIGRCASWWPPRGL